MNRWDRLRNMGNNKPSCVFAQLTDTDIGCHGNKPSWLRTSPENIRSRLVMQPDVSRCRLVAFGRCGTSCSAASDFPIRRIARRTRRFLRQSRPNAQRSVVLQIAHHRCRCHVVKLRRGTFSGMESRSRMQHEGSGSQRTVSVRSGRRSMVNTDPIIERDERPYVYEIGGTWGDAINFTDWKTGRVHGWKFRRPVVGDLVRIPCRSGKTLIGKFVTVEYANDPHDMFFGTLETVGYEGDPPTAQH